MQAEDLFLVFYAFSDDNKHPFIRKKDFLLCRWRKRGMADSLMN